MALSAGPYNNETNLLCVYIYTCTRLYVNEKVILKRSTKREKRMRGNARKGNHVSLMLFITSQRTLLYNNILHFERSSFPRSECRL
jgi:hypothetical protein